MHSFWLVALLLPVEILDCSDHGISIFGGYLKTTLLREVITQGDVVSSHHFFIAFLAVLWSKLSLRCVNVRFCFKVFNINIGKCLLKDFVFSSFHEFERVKIKLFLLYGKVLLSLNEMPCRGIDVTL